MHRIPLTTLAAMTVMTSLLTACAARGPQLPVSAGPDWPTDWRPTTGHPRPIGVPHIDVTQDNVPFTWHCDPTVIDTRTFADQHQVDTLWGGPTQRPGKLLPAHKHLKPVQASDGPPNELRAGGLTRGDATNNHFGFQSIGQTPWTPPDPSLAVGPQHVVVTVNMAIAWYDKQGNEQFSSYLDSTGSPGFFEGVGGGDFTFDPKCFYDPVSERFVVLALEYYGDTDEAWITFAVSDDSDPNGVWHKYRTWAAVTDGGTTYWVDYPGLGYDENAFYVTGNLFPLGSGGFGGVLYRVIEKAAVLSGGTAIVHDVRKSGHASVQAAQHHGDAPAAFFVSRRDNTRLRLSRIEDYTNPVVQSNNVNVPSFDAPSSDAPNPGGTVSTLDGRILNVHWRDDHLYTCHAINGPSSNTVSRWYDFDVTNISSGVLAQSGDIVTSSGVHNFFPAIGVNQHGDIALVMAMASQNDNPSIQVTGRTSQDPTGTMGALHETATGTAGADGRYGDYYDMTVDPVDDTTFWYVGEYSTNGLGWQCHVGRFTITEPNTCPADVDGDNVVGINDLLAAIGQWGGDGSAAGIAEPYDTVDISDILVILAAFGSCP